MKTYIIYSSGALFEVMLCYNIFKQGVSVRSGSIYYCSSQHMLIVMHVYLNRTFQKSGTTAEFTAYRITIATTEKF